jgi:hypothetical protein
LAHCDLETGAVIFYEQFEGIDGVKDRYFVVISNCGPVVECFTTTTQLHAETNPKLATEFCEISEGECCLPKRCFVDFRKIHSFDDIQLGSRLRSKSVKYLGDIETDVLLRIRRSLAIARSISDFDKERLLAAIDEQINFESGDENKKS